ncbi:MAG: RimK/LysX family protein [Luminiphilus sp.]|nr:RimK/LysX family protein [Luminiphilus sp.]
MKNEYIFLGWREWVELSALGIGPLQAKIDTGAKTSALHATHLEFSTDGDNDWVSFTFEDAPHDQSPKRHTARVVEFRNVTNSGGQMELRPVIETSIQIGKTALAIELTLTERSNMAYAMLIGRTTMQRQFVVNPSVSFLLGGSEESPETTS